MTSPSPTRLVLLVALACGSVACISADALEGETLLLTVDNDSYTFEDGNYSNGTALTWASAKLEEYPPTSYVRRAGERLGFWAPDAARQLSLTLGQLIFTPEDLTLANPPQDAHPYAGIVFLDLGVHARSEDDLTSVTLRVGAVGSASFAEEAQTELHEIFGAEDPRGWQRQLRDEPLLNLGFERHRRVLQGKLGSSLEWDLAPNWGAAAGTFFTGANVGLALRIGQGLERTLGSHRIRTSFSTTPVLAVPDDDGPLRYGFAGIEAYGVAWYLPVDGNAFQNSRSAEAEPWVGTGSLGFTWRHRSLGFTFAYTLLSDTYEAQKNLGQYGTVSLSWSP